MVDLNISVSRLEELGMAVRSPFGPGGSRDSGGGRRRLLVSARPKINPSALSNRIMKE